MSQNVIQTSFAAGELSPTMFARVDLDKFHIGAAKMLNFFVDYKGGATNRPGLGLVARVLKSSTAVRLIPFQFSVVQNYILEFGDLYMRVIKNGALVTELPKTLTGITNAIPGVFTANAHGYANGDQLFFLVNGMTQINDKVYFAANVTANTFQVTDWSGNLLNTLGFGVFTSGTVARVVKITSPYAAADLSLLKFTQSADVLSITHPSYPPYDLSRTSDSAWTFTQVSLAATILPPAGTPSATVSPATAGSVDYRYVVTAIDANGQESVASNSAHAASAIDISATAGSVSISWLAVANAVAYNVYKALPVRSGTVPTGALYGYMTTVTGQANVTAVDTNIVPDFTIGPPTHQNPLNGNNPATVTYDQQRKVYAGSNAQPETFWMSKTGQFANFDVSSPVQADDAITGTLVSRQVNQVKHMVSMPNGLIMLTSGGAWQVSGASGVLSPTTINATPQAYNGAGDVPPVTINYEILYVQQKGTIVRDLSYSFYTNIYTGTDISVLSNHLFLGYTINEWAYAEEPFKIVWAVRSDGSLLSLTYLKEHNIAGWAVHQTQGRFKSVASIPEGSEDAVYFVVQRWVQGQQISFIERMHTRLMPYGVEDGFFVDCGLSYVPTTPAANLSLSAASGNGVTAFADAPVFQNTDVGSVIRAGKGIMTVTAYLSSQQVTVNITQNVQDTIPFTNPAVVWQQPSGTWTLDKPFTTISNLDHLEGQTVVGLGDGSVIPPQVVTNGQITLPTAVTKLSVGLGYTAQLQTLYLDTGEPTIQGKRKNIPAMSVRVANSRGMQMGPTFSDLVQFKDRDPNTLGTAIQLFTGDDRAIIGGGWNTTGQVCVQQSDPLPTTVLGIIPEIVIGDDGK